MNDVISREQLERLERIGAFLDNEVADPERHAELAAQIAASDADRALLARLRAQREDLKRLAFADAIRRPAVRRHAGPWQVLRLGLAATIVLAVGGTAGWYVTGRYLASDRVQAIAFADESAVAYQLFTATDALPAALTAQELPTLQPILAQYFGSDISIPLRIGTDFALQRLQILSDKDGPAIQVTYIGARGARIALRIGTAKAGAASSKFEWSVKDGVRICYWRSQHAKFALSGVFSREEMLGLAKTVTKLKPKSKSAS